MTVSVPASIAQLRRRFSGQLLRPGDEGYDAGRRIWNGMIDRHPGLIARCTSTSDVAAAVQFARTQGLLVAVRGGGHNVAGTAVCDDGLIIDLSPMKRIQVDPVRRTVRADPGLLWGELDRETQTYGLALPGGIVTHTGVAGLTLGGGIGWLMRKHGLTCDSLLSADVVSADERFLTASETAHADLFWGIRGGGGNFGIVTSFEFRLHPVGPTVLAGVVLYSASDAAEVLGAYRDCALAAPDELTTILSLRHAPAIPALPERLHGRPVVSVGVCYAGSIADGERAIQPLRALGRPLVDLIRPVDYTAHQGMFDATVPHGLRYYWKSHYLSDLTPGVIETLAGWAWRATSPMSYTIIFQLGGTVRRIGDDATAFNGRGAAYALNINGIWSDIEESEEHIRWTAGFWGAMRPYSTGGVYMNFLGNEGEDRVQAAYGAAKYARLVAIKNSYDPTNFFRLNQNIKPSASQSGRSLSTST